SRLSKPARRFRLDRGRRLTSSRAFDELFASGARRSNEYFVLLERPSGHSGPRLGIAISKRAVPEAHDRSRIKRIVRESYRLNAERMRPVDIVVQVRARARDARNRELFAALDRLWRPLCTKA